MKYAAHKGTHFIKKPFCFLKTRNALENMFFFEFQKFRSVDWAQRSLQSTELVVSSNEIGFTYLYIKPTYLRMLPYTTRSVLFKTESTF